MAVAATARVAAFVVLYSGCGESQGDPAPGADSLRVASRLVYAAQDADRELVLRARALDRAGKLDSARILYEEAAKRVPFIGDWLYLRAAGVSAATADRARYFRKLDLRVALDRRRATEAIAMERTGDVEGAIEAYEEAGDTLSAIRLGFVRVSDSVRTAQARRALVAYLERRPGREKSRDAIALFEKVVTRATPGEHLAVARAAVDAGSASRAVTAYTRAFAARLGTSRDRFDNALMLARLDRDAEAATQFALIREPAFLAAAARYQRARALLAMGKRNDARAALREITTSFPGDTSAASALLLLSDLATDDLRDQDARATMLTIVHRFPRTRHAPVALFRAGLVAFVMGDHGAAAAELDSVFRLYPSSDEALAAGYWSGRASAQRGDTGAANSRWREVLARERGSYYSVNSARRLGVPLLEDSARVDPGVSVDAVDAALRRIAVLRNFGMDLEVRFEYDRLFRDAPLSPQRLVATARAFSGTEQASRGAVLGRRAVSELGPSAVNYRLMYPVVERETLTRSSRAHDLDPPLVAALIKQESNFNPNATSPVGARGLMQLMPSVGTALARSEGMRNFTAAGLYDPVVNIRLGTRHLAALFRSTAQVERVLAAYNAGQSRVSRWTRKSGSADPELFTERIPFVETRDYVRAVVRNRAFYGALYEW